jgi:hypothetical protein
MKKVLAVMLLLAAALVFGQQNPPVSARGVIGRTGAASSGPFYTGDGGQNIRLAVLAPQTQGSVPDYLPLFVQGLLNSNFTRFSAITVISRQDINKIITSQNIGANGKLSETDYVNIGKSANAQYCCFGFITRVSEERYLLELSFKDINTGVSKDRFTRDGAPNQIEGSGALVNQATAFLLAQLGVLLNDDGRRTLLAENGSAAGAQASLARGITAGAKDLQAKALLNYSLSVAFDPSGAEAASYLKALSSEISGGTITRRTVNDKQARGQWLEAFKETAQFFNSHPPFEIIFDPNLAREGAVDYENRTVNLAMRIALDPSKTGFAALNTILEGLEKTGKRKQWGFSGWPLLYVNPRVPGTVVFGGKKSFSYRVDAALVNESNRILGRGSITLKAGELIFALGDKNVPILGGDAGMIRFPGVNIDEISKTLTIFITSVNWVSSSQLNASSYMKIDSGDLEKRTMYRIGFRGPAGGFIFYDKGKYKDGWRYLEAAPNDLGYAAWGAAGKDIPGTETGVGTGKQNTQIIIEKLTAWGETGKAAQLCASLNINGFNDWFLPSKNELALMYSNLQERGVGGFSGRWYWSSSQDNKNKLSWNQYFNGGEQHLNVKDYTLSIRAIRAF